MIGERLGPYTIDRELGSGGMGKVYAAVVEGRCPGLDEGTRVALKVVHPHLLETAGFFKRFLREAEIGKTVRHPNVVRTYDCDAVGGQHFMAMEYVEGQTLRELLDELERVPEELCRHIAREVCKGLAAIHDAGVIHRDMKPDNVLITGDHVVKVMDLGVARLADEQLRLSQTGAFVGSIHYAAPESLRDGGKHVDGRADLHALGLVLYELACGTNPYLADDVPKTLQKVLHEVPRRLGDLNPQLSPFFEEVVHCLLAKEADERFADANKLLRALEDGEDSAWWHRRASMIRTLTKRPLRRVRIPRETAVYGREDELTLLRSLFERATAGEGQVLLIEGEAGIGKSRLVDEFVGRLQREDMPLNFLFGSYPPGGAATASGGFSTAFREQFGDAGCREYLRSHPVLIAAFDALLCGEPTPKGEEPLTKESLQTCFVCATRALAEERTTIILIDDLHFAPDEGRALFTSLAMAAPGHRVMLIGTARPGVSEKWVAGVARLDHSSQLSLHRLGPKDLVALLQDSLSSERLARELSAQIAVKSDGNPFFVFEIIRGLREGQFITQAADGTWVSTRAIDEIAIPASVLELVNARVADLSEEERDVLDVASCWGFEFDPVVVGAALGLGRIPALKRLGQIERRHRLVRSQGRTYAFDHHQVQEALYGALNDYLREEYHAALAESFERNSTADRVDVGAGDGAISVALCEQYLKGARGESALRHLADAQKHLSGGHLHAEMAALTERTLAVSGLLTGDARVRVLLRLGDALHMLGNAAREEEVAHEAAGIAEHSADDALRGAAAAAVGQAAHAASRLEDAQAAFELALTLAQSSGDLAATSRALRALAAVVMEQGEAVRSEELAARAVVVARQSGDRLLEANAVGVLGVVLGTAGRMSEAGEHFKRQSELSREVGDRAGDAQATANFSNVLRSGGRHAEAWEHAVRATAVMRELGNRGIESLSEFNLSTIAYELGRLPDAAAHADRALALSEETGNKAHEASARLARASIAMELGDGPGSVACGHAALALGREMGSRIIAARAHEMLGIAHTLTGAVAAARESLNAAVTVARELGIADIETHALCVLAAHHDGDPDDALAAVAENEGRFDVDESRRARFLLWRATGDRAHLEAAKRLLDETVAYVDDETRNSMLTNLRVNREIMAAWHAEFGAD